MYSDGEGGAVASRGAERERDASASLATAERRRAKLYHPHKMNMEFTEKLITLVHQHPCLYDCRVKNYKNISKKERLWDQIAIQLNQNSDTIRTKWKNLKDGYAKYKKKKNKYGNWVWGPYLGFLDGTAAIRNKIPTDNCESPTSAEAREVSAELLSYNPEENGDDVDASAANSSIQEFLSLRDPLSSRGRKRPASDDEYTDDKLSIQYNNMEQKDSIDLLFESYAKSLKQMKPRTQAAIKIKLAQIFADAELEDLQHKLQSGNQTEQIFTVLTGAENENFPAPTNYDNGIKRE